MNRKVLLALFGVGLGTVGVAALTDFERGSDVPKEKRGLLVGTMPDFKSVKLKAVPKPPDYLVNNDDIQIADPETVKFIRSYSGAPQLELLVEYYTGRQ